MTRRNAFRAPGFRNLDIGFYKTFRLTERYSLQLRSEFYNVFNHANMYVSYPDADISASSYVPTMKGLRPDGTVERRNVRLAAKFIF
jgi:hypothetical protein